CGSYSHAEKITAERRVGGALELLNYTNVVGRANTASRQRDRRIVFRRRFQRDTRQMPSHAVKTPRVIPCAPQTPQVLPPRKLAETVMIIESVDEHAPESVTVTSAVKVPPSVAVNSGEAVPALARVAGGLAGEEIRQE